MANPLFISYSKPHKPVQAATISRWIRNMLVKAGVDSNFKTHSTRAASTSAAKNRGMTTKDIMCAADWSRSPPSSVSTISPWITHLARPSYRPHPLVRKLSFEHTLSCMNLHDIELQVSQGSVGPDVRPEFY